MPQTEPKPPALENYEYSHRIAVGGMAEIFLAWQRGPSGFRRPVAVKQPLPELTGDPEFVNMFVRESQIASDLTHQNIVGVLDVLTPKPNECLIVMEYIHGHTLRSLMRASYKHKVAIPLEVTLYVISSICAALDYAYFTKGAGNRPRHIVHRDVTPTNVLISMDGQVKLGDFGIARSYAPDAYMSPEQTRSEPLDQRSDIFSVGAILYEMATGRQAFYRADGELAIAKAVLSEPVVDPQVYVPDMSTGMLKAIERSLARDRNERYDRAGDIASALAEAHGWSQAVAQESLARLMQRLFPETPPLQYAAGEIEGGSDSTGARATVVVTKSRRRFDGTAPPGGAPPVAPRKSIVPPILLVAALLSAIVWTILIINAM
jgi:serine/threonine protein kinase